MCKYVASYQQVFQLSLGKAHRTARVRSQAFDSQSRKEGDWSEVRQFYARYVNGTLFRILQ